MAVIGWMAVNQSNLTIEFSCMGDLGVLHFSTLVHCKGRHRV